MTVYVKYIAMCLTQVNFSKCGCCCYCHRHWLIVTYTAVDLPVTLLVMSIPRVHFYLFIWMLGQGIETLFGVLRREGFFPVLSQYASCGLINFCGLNYCDRIGHR